MEKKEAVILTPEELKTGDKTMKQLGEIEITFVPMSRKGDE